jgi:hypothetical protein
MSERMGICTLVGVEGVEDEEEKEHDADFVAVVVFFNGGGLLCVVDEV